MNEAVEKAKMHAAHCRRLINEAATPLAAVTVHKVPARVERLAKLRKTKLAPEGMKLCSVCGRIKLLDDFHDNPNGKLGKRAMCKECYRERSRERMRRKREQLKTK